MGHIHLTECCKILIYMPRHAASTWSRWWWWCTFPFWLITLWKTWGGSSQCEREGQNKSFKTNKQLKAEDESLSRRLREKKQMLGKHKTSDSLSREWKQTMKTPEPAMVSIRDNDFLLVATVTSSCSTGRWLWTFFSACFLQRGQLKTPKESNTFSLFKGLVHSKY